MGTKDNRKGRDKIAEAISGESPIREGGYGSILSALFQQVLRLKMKNFGEWDFYMDAYLKNPRNKVLQDHRSITSTRSNMLKELLKAHMSWKVFCKGFSFLLVKRFEIRITLHFDKGETAEIYQDVDLQAFENESEEEEVGSLFITPPNK